MTFRSSLCLCLCLFLSLILVSDAHLSIRPTEKQPRNIHVPEFSEESLEAGLGNRPPLPPPYVTKFYPQTLDHFSFVSNANFSQRYLVADTYWNTTGRLSNGCPGPVLFYTGNEGDITWFYQNTGFVTRILAPLYGGLIVFAEHRYYGDSMPFGNQSLTPENAIYLTSEQALADYAELIEYLKNTNPSLAKCPFIAFGGSYGGMLSSWFRIKYPHIVAGALAASAPIVQFEGTGVSEYVYNQIVTQDFAGYNSECASQIQVALQTLVRMGGTASGRATLSSEFHLCSPLQSTSDVYTLYEWVYNAFSSLAMVDYPYPANFLAPLPGWPVDVACQQMLQGNSSSTLIPRLVHTIAVYYNYTGQSGSCFNIDNEGSPDLGDEGWTYQACTEMIMPIAANGKTDMFIPYPYDLKSLSQYCKETWSSVIRPLWVPTFYGGFNISTATNIVFSNGQLDPWRGGGIQSSAGLHASVVTVIIEEGAHHLDLRTPNTNDPPSVTAARQLEIDNINSWIEQYLASHP